MAKRIKKERERDFLKKLEEAGYLYFYLVSLISSDSLFTVEDCEESLKEIEFCLEVLSENNLENEDKIREMLLDGKEIVERDMEIMKKED